MNKELLKQNCNFLEKISKEFLLFDSAEFLPNDYFELTYQNDNLKASSTNNFKNIYQLKHDQNELKFSRVNKFPQQANLSTTSYSPDFNYMAVLQQHPGKFDEKKKKFLEIYNDDHLIQSLNLEEFHEEILKGGTFGKPFVWNKQENKIMYLAKLKEPSKQSFWENQLKEKQFEEAYNTPQYLSDLGEQFENIYDVGLFIYNLDEQTLEQVLLPDNFLPFFPQFWDEQGNEIILSGLINEKNFKLGLYACINRECGIYLLEKNFQKKLLFPKKEEDEDKEKDKEINKPKLQDFVVISKDPIAMFPKVSPDLQKIVYFASPLQKAHQFIMELKLYEKNSKETKTVIPIEQKINEKLKFAGITGQQAKFHWFENSNYGLLNTHIDNDYHFYLVNTQTNEFQLISPEIEKRKTMNSILAINKFNNDILFKSANFQNMIELKLMTGLNFEQNSLDACCKNIKIHTLQYQNNTSKIMSQAKAIISQSKETKLIVKNSQANGILYSIENYQTDYLKKFNLNSDTENQVIKDEDKPLIIIIHGGPHSTSGNFTLMRLIFLLKGYNILVPNYSGTLGYGQEFIDTLLGKISELEFNEITELISQAIQQKLCDPQKIIPMGGSNGGYLTGLLAGKTNLFNIEFLGGILMNPVLNLPYMAIASDIIDWIYSECFNKFFENYMFTTQDYAKMYEQSPMNYPSKIPLLLLLGKVDRRVPYHQGLAYTVQCQRNSCNIETFIYPKSNHALGDSINTEYDVMLRCLHFIEKLLQKQ